MFARSLRTLGVTVTVELFSFVDTVHTVNMANIQVAPTKAELELFLRKGMTQAQIVDAWEKKTGVRVSRSAVAMAISRYGLQSAHPRPRHEDLLPWHVKDEHKHNIEARMLRMEGRRRKGLPLSKKNLDWLTKWRELLEIEQAVVHYDPDTVEGFHWVKRKPSDDDIIRRPKS